MATCITPYELSVINNNVAVICNNIYVSQKKIPLEASDTIPEAQTFKS